MAVVTTMAVKTIRALIDGLDEDYEAAKKLFLKLWRDAGAVHKWVGRYFQVEQREKIFPRSPDPM